MRGDIRHEYDEMVIRGDINYGNNGQSKGSMGEGCATAANEYDQVDALPSFFSLCRIINLEMLLRSTDGCFLFL